MARKLRLQYAGAVYHVINRGNYRRDIFETAGAAEAFLRVLREASETYGWEVFAYVVMRNHYHVALTTPEPNLVEGMHWLQSTLATRFNRYRQENGHLFQGRYQALVVEDDAALGRVVDYIHLNPVRARAVKPSEVATFPWSSLAAIGREPENWWQRERWLRATGGWADDQAGRQAYATYLTDLATSETRWEGLGLTGLAKGWAIGTAGWRRTLAKEYGHLALNPGLAQSEVRELREAAWAAALASGLRALGKTSADLVTKPKSPTWKIALAQRVREESGASLTWLADALQIGRPETLRSYLYRQRLTENP
jgi:putative transposase